MVESGLHSPQMSIFLSAFTVHGCEDRLTGLSIQIQVQSSSVALHTPYKEQFYEERLANRPKLMITRINNKVQTRQGKKYDNVTCKNR